MRGERKLIHGVTTWVRRQPPKVKAFLAVVSGMVALVLLRFIVHDHDNLFVAAEAVHSLGISVLIYKLIKEKTCAGRSHPPLPFLRFYIFLLDFYLIFHKFFICLEIDCFLLLCICSCVLYFLSRMNRFDLKWHCLHDLICSRRLSFLSRFCFGP